MNNPNAADNLTPYKEGQSGNPAGKPIGAKNRSTIARKVLEMKGLFKDATFEKLIQEYPEITKETTVEEIMTIIQVDKAISEQDEKAYRALMDSAYGAPKQEIDQLINGGLNISLSKEEIKQIAKDLEDSV